jgi:muconolactone delta-isomerase
VFTEQDKPMPPEIAPALFAATKAWKARYTAAGKIEHIWGFAGLAGGAGIANVDSHEELDRIAAEFPFQPFSKVTVYPLADFDKSMDNATNAFQAMMAGMAKH